MTSDRLEKLLRDADQAAGLPPRLPKDVPQRVLQHARPRWRSAANLGSAAAVVFLAAGVTILLRSTGPDLLVRPINHEAESAAVAAAATAAKADIFRLEREADVRLAIVRRTGELKRRLDQRAALDAALRRPDPRQYVAAGLDQAALALLRQGDQLYEELGLRDPAVESYRQIVRLFPTTPTAMAARQRLREMDMPEGAVL